MIIIAFDIDFLIQQFSKIKDELVYELPSFFAERVRVLTSDVTPFPGRFGYERFPYFREIVDCFHPLNPIQVVIMCKGNQLGFTTAVLETIILYNIMSDPKPQMYVTADAGLMKISVQTKIEKMIDNAGARKLIFSQAKKNQGSKDTGDTAVAKEYPGGYLHMYGGRSANRFRGMSYKVALGDEVDAYPDTIKSEGTVVDLIMSRTNAYSTHRKMYFGSTPLVKQTSKIWKLYEEGDQRKYLVPCKHCGGYQELVWHGKRDDGAEYGITFEKDIALNPIIETVAYTCRFCGEKMKNWDKATIMQHGRWEGTAKSKSEKTRSYHLSPLYNPPGMYSWEDMVHDFASCWDFEHNRVKDKEKYRTFRNTKQGLPFEETGTQIKYEKAVLFRRHGFIRGSIPNDIALRDTGSGVLIVCGAVDVQKHNLYVDIKGYTVNGCSFTIDFIKIEGDTEDFNGPWDELYNYLTDTIFTATDGKQYRVLCTLVDSGRYTEYVYAFCQRFTFGVYASKGTDYIKAGETFRLFDKATLDRIGLPLAYHINTTKLKDRISNSLNYSMWSEGQLQPYWYPNFPDDFKDDYFKMFEAEHKVDEYDRKTNQYLRTIWKERPGAPNHAFDTFVYSLAALEIIASDCCYQVYGVKGINWELFWQYAKEGNFYEE